MSTGQRAIDETLLLLRSLESLVARAHEAPLTQPAVAALVASFGAHVEQLARIAQDLPKAAADNDQGQRRCALYETLSAGPDRTLYVARLGTRWFVLEGFSVSPIANYAVRGPFDGHRHALEHAERLHGHAIRSCRTRLHAVERTD